jgi:serine/threonine-protein kinase
MEKLQTYIGALAVEKNFLTQSQLDECIHLLDQQDAEAESSQHTIEKILLQKCYLSEDKLKILQGKRNLHLRKLETQALVDYIKKMKAVPPEKLVKCLEIQEKAQQEQKKYIPLTNLLVAHGLIEAEKAEELLQSKAVRRVVQQAIWNDDPRRSGFVGRVLGGYEIVSKIAAGGMGVVYRAMQIELERIVALKILFEKFAVQKKHLNQFFREAKLSATFNHPNLVHIFDMGHEQGFHYYAMELVEGKNVGDYLHEKTKLAQQEALDIITQAGRGLEHIHSFDVMHRDIKPSNFIMRADGIVKIMDLGLAQEITRGMPPKSAQVGTPYYMSPELIHNPSEVDQRADIYALGVAFYRLLTAEYPITGSDAKEILKNIAEQTPAPVTQHDSSISPEIEKVINKMLAKDPKVRYQNMSDVLNDLDRILLE